eukprot:scaffold2292_cov301-Pavlova_lutheri.AAC.16
MERVSINGRRVLGQTCDEARRPTDNHYKEGEGTVLLVSFRQVDPFHAATFVENCPFMRIF